MPVVDASVSREADASVLPKCIDLLRSLIDAVGLDAKRAIAQTLLKPLVLVLSKMKTSCKRKTLDLIILLLEGCKDNKQLMVDAQFSDPSLMCVIPEKCKLMFLLAKWWSI